MSGLEVLGAVSAASALLETAIKLFSRIRRAQAQQKELPALIQDYSDEVENIKDILALIEEQDALRTAKVASEVTHIETIAQELVDFLESIDPKDKSVVRRFGHQLVHGSKDEKTIEDIWKKLKDAKSNLSLRIHVALVGVAKTIENKLIANTTVIERMDEILKQVFGDGRGLKLAELIKEKPTRDDGTVVLSDDDVKELGAEVAGGDAAAVIPTSRIVVENTSEEQAFQINGPIGKDGWWEVSNLEIRNNRATGKAIQVNHGISVDTFDKLLRNRGANMDK